MGLIRTYVDDSADQTQEKVVLAGAYIGWWHQWSKLRIEWKRILKRNDISFFHATECRSLRGEFFKYRDAKKYPKPLDREAANKIRDDLAAVIHKSGVGGVAACIPMQDYKAIRANEPHAAEIFPADACEMALQALFQLCSEDVQRIIKPDIGRQKVAFICDYSDSARRIVKMFTKFRDEHPEYADILHSLAHQDDKKQPQLQAADLMAHTAKDRFNEWADDPAIFTNNPELKKRMQDLSVFTIAVCHRKWLMKTLNVERKKRGLG